MKSVTVTAMLIVTGGEGSLVPATPTLNVPAVEPVQLKIDVAEEPRVTLGGFKEQERPAGEVAARLTTPEKPLFDVTVIVELPEAPALKVKLAGLAVILKV